MLVRFGVPGEDVALYGGGAGDSWRAAVPRRVLCVWRDTLRALPAGGAAALHDYLSAAGYTACFAAVLRESGHLVDYGPCEALKFFALTRRGAASGAGLCVDPASSMAALRSFGLSVVAPRPAVELASDEYAALREEVARRRNCKGAVMYGY
ncbi:dynein heavy chain, cytosolic, partial [Trypanosoma conorhini]